MDLLQHVDIYHLLPESSFYLRGGVETSLEA